MTWLCWCAHPALVPPSLRHFMLQMLYSAVISFLFPWLWFCAASLYMHMCPV